MSKINKEIISRMSTNQNQTKESNKSNNIYILKKGLCICIGNTVEEETQRLASSTHCYLEKFIFK